MAYNHDLYISNCRKMVRLNQEQVDNHLELLKQETDPNVKKDLSMEVQGWVRWVKIWKERLSAAEENTKYIK